jgi:NAD(P)-dependent dehydrogenase (short-subunit alcohol dehydrogenase family)
VSELEGRVIAIAGAAGGLGPAVARRLAADGASLALTDRDQERLDSLTSELELEQDRGLDARVVDLLDQEAAGAWAEGLVDRFGRVDGLLHLVGGWRGGEPLASFDLGDYEILHDLLVRTVIHATRAFHDQLAASEHGRFVLVSSAQAQDPDGTNAAYGATKAAAETWTLALADSFRKAESAATANVIVVNAILTEAMRAESPEKPFRTFTSAEDIAGAIAFVCSDAGQKMNGKRLPLHPLR